MFRPTEYEQVPIVGTTMTDTRTNMRLEGVVIGSQLRITEWVIKIQLHRDRELWIVILAQVDGFSVVREQRRTLLHLR